MRGSSALEEALRDAPGARAWVVWEPVLTTDFGPPTASTSSRVTRASQLWDAHRALSDELRKKPWSDPDGEIVWDFVAVFPPGARWGDAPSFHGGPVVRVAEGLRRALQESGRR
ncbi:MAG: hypothetical protein E6J78_16800 [Deltaproteobacteria bacterium]|nr:MAG: hypothetical protein E6J78_16800 [Deltaproteobacteria bacterium]